MKVHMKYLSHIFGVLVCLAMTATMAVSLGGDDAEELIQQIQEKYENLKDFSCHFSQSVEFSVTKSTQRFQGSLWVQRGNKYHIEVEDQIIVTNGRTVWSFSRATNQVLIDRYREDIGGLTPDRVLVDILDRYTVTPVDNETAVKDRVSILKLNPKERLSNMKWLKLWIDTDQLLLQRVQVQDVMGNLTTYDVSDMKFNAGLSDSLFLFHPPEGAEIVDLR